MENYIEVYEGIISEKVEDENYGFSFRCEGKEFMVFENDPMFMPIGRFTWSAEALAAAEERQNKFPEREIGIVLVD